MLIDFRPARHRWTDPAENGFVEVQRQRSLTAEQIPE